MVFVISKGCYFSSIFQYSWTNLSVFIYSFLTPFIWDWLEEKLLKNFPRFSSFTYRQDPSVSANYSTKDKIFIKMFLSRLNDANMRNLKKMTLVIEFLVLSLVLLLTSLTSILFFTFSSYITLSSILCNLFPFSLPFFLLLLFFCLLNLIYGFCHSDWLNTNTRCIVLAAILALNKILSFHNKTHAYPYQKI